MLLGGCVPELPEVETLARDLRRLLCDAEISGVEARWARTVAVPCADELTKRLPGHKILDVRRRGKFLILSLSGPSYLMIHLRMSGQLRVEPGTCEPDPYARLILHLADGRQLIFSDTRKFGRVYWTTDPGLVLGSLGPEPLAQDLTVDDFATLLSSRRGMLKPLLLNQGFLAGLGNIYTDEALFLAGLHPRRKANTLSHAEVERLYGAIRQVLRQAIAGRGTTLSDERYLDAEGSPGTYAERLRVYRRAGEPCTRCGATLERIVVAGRGTHICPDCQNP